MSVSYPNFGAALLVCCSSSAFYNPLFAMVMSRDRFVAIRGLIRFVTKEELEAQPGPGTPLYDRRAKIQPLVDRVIANGQRYYQLGQQVSLDEQSVPSKGARFGVVCTTR